jgi:hypothetical protein
VKDFLQNAKSGRQGERFNSSESGEEPLDLCGLLNLKISIEKDHEPLSD